MNLRCPNCGAVHSLDSLLGGEDAAQLLKLVLDMDAAIGKAAVRYLGLFRPAKSQLGFARAARSKSCCPTSRPVRSGAAERRIPPPRPHGYTPSTPAPPPATQAA